ncbi:MAG: NRDE family protein [Balneolaceae bacterium]|nr:NRDE family protein [Balneolaceae bacterium]
MCLIVFSHNHHPVYKLILAANRDEFYKRPSRAAQFWKNEHHPEILAGQDLKGKGTWLGIHKDGRWGALTNYRSPLARKKNPPTRGKLVIDYLKEEQSARQYLDQVHPQSNRFNGFNLLLGDQQGLFHYSNHEQQIHSVAPGIHGISNASLNTPWPKLKTARHKLRDITHSDQFEKEELFTLLQNKEKAPMDQLPDTGITPELERAVSSIFIKTKSYGTRCSTLVLMDYEGNIDFTERRYKAGSTDLKEENHYRINKK